MESKKYKNDTQKNISHFDPSCMGIHAQRPSQLSTIEKKGAFLLPKIEFSPSNPTSEKIIASFKFLLWIDTIIYQKIEKVSQKKYFLNDFTSNHPIATQIPVLDNF